MTATLPQALDTVWVRRLQGEVGQRLAAAARAARDAGGPRLTGEDERQHARSVIAAVVAADSASQLRAGQAPPSPQVEEAAAEAVFAGLFGAGRLQLLLDDPRIENVDINGADEVFVSYADGRRERVGPVAASDAELVEQIQILASFAGLNARAFDDANPELDLRLPDGTRLSAVRRVTARPAVSLRRHRFPRVFLTDLVANGTLSEDLAQFLSAVVRARRNVMIAGETDTGKTTLLRALVNQIDPTERLCTVENSLELGLRAHPDLHPDVVELEAVPANSEGVGEVTMARLVRRTLRMNPDRVIVGEVLGPEVITMLNAMSQGNDGSLSTIHARTARGVFDRIATYARQAEERLDLDATHQLIAGGEGGTGALDLVVFLRKTRPAGGDPADAAVTRRFVAAVLEVTGYDRRVQSSEIFNSGPDGHALRNPMVPIACLEALLAVGYRPADH
ncbi:MAG TPA: ATPase, T2SS/T4P/T4SS family [Sporichthyaceae bacterium]|jgi:Flp pilus assembly CpaF family ATPase|nr:ATPase, T2SS/T4P/T4SS family [Sporichthyaceae bacterium]